MQYLDKTGLSYFWNKIVAKLTSKADDNAVVHKTGSETIAGAKTFTSPVKITTNTNNGFELYSPSSGGYLNVTRGGDTPVTMSIKSGTNGGTFGTSTNHQFQFRTNDTARIVLGIDGSVKLQQDVPTNSNDGQVASTKWVNAKGYLTQHQDISGKENSSNKVTSISSSSTNTQYPSAKAVYDYIQSLDSREVSY